jgi:hypothetical protein
MMLVLQACRMQEFRVMEASTKISKEDLGQTMCGGIKIHAHCPREGKV